MDLARYKELAEQKLLEEIWKWAEINENKTKEKLFKMIFSQKEAIQNFVLNSFFNKKFIILKDWLLYDDQIYMDIFTIKMESFSVANISEIKKMLNKSIENKMIKWYVLKFD